MIVRSWRARASQETAPLYVQHAQSHVFPDIAKLAGHRGALLLRRDSGSDVEIIVLTFWSSMQAIAAFAGLDLGLAVVEPQARAVLGKYVPNLAESW